MEALYIKLLIAYLVAMTCSILGTFLMLRKQLMVGDAISHGVLPGIVLGFLVTGVYQNIIFLFGALGAALFFAFFVAFLRQKAGLREGESIALVSSSMFALGVLLIHMYGKKMDLDMGCVLFGNLDMAHVKSWYWGSTSIGPIYLYQSAFLWLLNMLVFLPAYPTWVLTSFDPLAARSMGVRTALWHYGLMAITSITVVVAFNIVGAYLVIGFLVIAPATALLFARTPAALLLHLFPINGIITFQGHWLASQMDTSLAGGMLLAGMLLFWLVWFLPKKQV